MQRNQQAKEKLDSNIKTEYARTDPQKVREEIQKDVSRGKGAMTSREAGAMQG
jgi:hypothetical protein